jgi:RNA polymerase sigma-70 factor (ECF subfamily)
VTFGDLPDIRAGVCACRVRHVPTDLDPNVLIAHHERVCRAARGLCASPQDADDLVQDTYVRLLAKHRRLKTSGADLGYLLRALRNMHVSNLRKRRTQAQAAELMTTCAEAFAPPSASPATVVFARELLREMRRLPADQRRAVTAVDLIGFSYGEAAQLLDTPVGTVMSRLYRGRARLSAALAA